MAALYQVYSDWLKDRYGEKVYKIPVNIPVTCPNRDGTLGCGGCIYCGEKGGGHENMSDRVPIATQISETIEKIEKKYKAHRFIIFFQSFSNTYLPIVEFKSYIGQALCCDQIVGLAIATRPDCIFEEQLEFLKDIQRKHHIDICIELGLQTANDRTLKKINRGHGLGDYIFAANLVKKFGFQLCTHVILDLPWDDPQDVITTAEVVSAVGSDFVKCHALYVEKHTILNDLLSTGEIQLYDEDEYLRRCILFLEHLDPQIVLQRVIGRAPQSDSVITNWHTSWWKLLEEWEAGMDQAGYVQGCLCDYLNGAALTRAGL